MSGAEIGSRTEGRWGLHHSGCEALLPPVSGSWGSGQLLMARGQSNSSGSWFWLADCGADLCDPDGLVPPAVTVDGHCGPAQHCRGHVCGRTLRGQPPWPWSKQSTGACVGSRRSGRRVVDALILAEDPVWPLGCLSGLSHPLRPASYLWPSDSPSPCLRSLLAGLLANSPPSRWPGTLTSSSSRSVKPGPP